MEPTELATTYNSFIQLQDVVAIIARYAVMENLYQQSGSALSLKPEYQAALLSLCSTILEYFASSFKVQLRCFNGSVMPKLKEDRIEVCRQLMDVVKEKDKACQGFRVLVEAKEDIETEVNFEDVSDDSWEEVHTPASDDGLIDLDAAIV